MPVPALPITRNLKRKSGWSPNQENPYGKKDTGKNMESKRPSQLQGEKHRARNRALGNSSNS